MAIREQSPPLPRRQHCRPAAWPPLSPAAPPWSPSAASSGGSAPPAGWPLQTRRGTQRASHYSADARGNCTCCADAHSIKTCTVDAQPSACTYSMKSMAVRAHLLMSRRPKDRSPAGGAAAAAAAGRLAAGFWPLLSAWSTSASCLQHPNANFSNLYFSSTKIVDSLFLTDVCL
jgi:hypothetical protein